MRIWRSAVAAAAGGGYVVTPAFMAFGDHIRMEAVTSAGHKPFDAIDQKVKNVALQPPKFAEAQEGRNNHG